MNSGPDTKTFYLNRSTLVPLGMVITMVLAVCAGTVWINNQLYSIHHKLQTIENNLNRCELKVESGQMDRWTASQMSLWVRLLQAENNSLKVPQLSSLGD